ncbi:hypothetical protein [Bradyrhizobium sp. USDA 4529]
MNGLPNLLHVSRYLQMYDKQAAQKGIRLSVGFDFHKYVSITRTTPTKGQTYPMFRPDRSPIKSGDGYWIVGVDKNNEVAVVEAARVYDLSCSSFAEHLESLKAFYANPTVHAHPQDRCTCTAPGAKKIRGRVAYHGDLWVRRDFRGLGMPSTMSGIARGISFAMWVPDFVCGLVSSQLVDRGVVAQYGYAHQEPGGAILRLVEDDISDDDWVHWLTGEELRMLVSGSDKNDISLTP